MTTSTILFARHGSATSSSDRYDADWDRALTEQGQNEAQRLARQIIRFQPSAIFCSPSRRALETASYAVRGLGTELQVRAGLMERVFPPLYGMKLEDIAAEYGAALRLGIEKNSDLVSLAGVESLHEARHRAAIEVDRIVREGHRRAAVISHGGPHSWVLADFLALPAINTRMLYLAPGNFSLLQWLVADNARVPQKILSMNRDTISDGLVASTGDFEMRP